MWFGPKSKYKRRKVWQNGNMANIDSIRFIKAQREFMDNQVKLWIARAAEDPELEVPHSVLKYYFFKVVDAGTGEKAVGGTRPLGHEPIAENVVSTMGPWRKVPDGAEVYGLGSWDEPYGRGDKVAKDENGIVHIE